MSLRLPAILFLAAPLFLGNPTRAQEVASADEVEPLARFLSQRMNSSTAGITVLFEQEATSGQYRGDSDIAAQRLSPTSGLLLWGADQSRPLSTSAYVERHITAARDGQGGVIAIFEAEAMIGEHAGDVELFAQRVDNTGTASWNGGSSSLIVASTDWSERRPMALSDANSGVLVFFEMHAPQGEHAGDVDIAAQRITAQGELAWSSGRGVAISSSPLIERHPTAVADGAGGAFVVFEGQPRVGERAGISGIFAQHVRIDGRRTWNNGQYPRTVSMSNWSETRPQPVTDGEGGFLVVFQQEAVNGEHTGDIDLAAQRFDAQGNALWFDGRRSANVSDTSFSETAHAVLSDGQGGAFVVFEAEPRSGERLGDSDLWAQRISADGRAQWNRGSPVFVATSNWSEKNPVLAPDGEGGVVVVFEQHAPRGEFAGDIDLGAQRIDADGNLLWGEGQRALNVANSEWKEHGPHVTADGSRGIVVVFEAEARSGRFAGDAEVLAQRLDMQGVLTWNPPTGPVPIAASTLREGNPVVISHQVP